jgi:hypothetical protein
MILRNGCQEYMKILLSSTGVACINKYFEIARNRIEEHIITASTQYDEENGVNAGSGALD